jgi:hypothetical protein
MVKRRNVMNWKRLVFVLVLCLTLILGTSTVAAAKPAPAQPTATLLVTGLDGGSGSAIGPGGDLYVAEPVSGQISRVDVRTGEVTTFASGLPQQLEILGLGGVMDVAFIGNTAFALVTLVADDWGGSDIVGIYRVDGPSSFTVVADIGTWSRNHLPTGFFIDTVTGVQYAMQPYRGGFLVTDGHHNRVLYVTLDGEITQVIAFGDIVPTGLAVRGNTIYMGEAGPIPHLPETSKIVTLSLGSGTATQLASGAGLNDIGLLVDVEFGRGNTLYALLQGYWDGPYEGAPATPNTGALVKVNPDGTFTILVDGLNQPTSMEFIGNTAYVVGLMGDVWKIEEVSAPPYGK